MAYHFKDSRTSTSLDEPVYLTKFVATFILPPSLRERYGTELLTEQIKRIGGLETNKMPEAVEQMYRFHKRRFAGSVVETNVDLEMEFEANVDENLRIYPYNILEDWSKLVYDPNTGFQTIKREYAGQVIIDLHDKVGNILRKWYFKTIFPVVGLTAMELNYGEESIYVPSITYAAENFEDLTN